MRSLAPALALLLSGCSPMILLIVESTRASREGSDRGALALESTVHGDTSNARDERAPGCGTHEGSGDQRWAFVAPATGRYRVRVDARYDSVLSIREPGGSERACNDDHGGTRASELELVLSQSEAIEVVVDGYRGNTGSYELRVSRLDHAEPPALAPGVTIAGQVGGSADVRTPGCGAIAGTGEATFLLVPDRTGPWSIEVTQQFDGVVAVYERGGMRELACNDDDGSTRRSRVTLELAAGVPVDVVVDGYHGQVGTFAIVARPAG